MLGFKKGCETAVSKHFKAREFDCRCSRDHMTIVSAVLVLKLEHIRELAGKPLVITSGYRCSDYQAELASRGYETVRASPHIAGLAVDLSCDGLSGEELAALALEAGFKRIGIAQAWIHVDVKPGSATWRYRK